MRGTEGKGRWTKSFCVARALRVVLRELPEVGRGMEETWQVGGVKHAGGKFRVKFAVKLLTEASTNHNAPWIRTAGIARDSPGSCRTPCGGLFLLAPRTFIPLCLLPTPFSLFTRSLSLALSKSDWLRKRSICLHHPNDSSRYLCPCAFVHGVHVYSNRTNPSRIICREIVWFTSHFQQRAVCFIAPRSGD